MELILEVLVERQLLQSDIRSLVYASAGSAGVSPILYRISIDQPPERDSADIYMRGMSASAQAQVTHGEKEA